MNLLDSTAIDLSPKAVRLKSSNKTFEIYGIWYLSQERLWISMEILMPQV